VTTIATDGKSMAGDGQRNHQSTITNRQAQKVRRLADGTLVGTAGDVAFGEMFVEWLEQGGERPKYEGDAGFTALVLKLSGELLLAGQDCKSTPIEAPYAIGSGMDLAIGAMRMGAAPDHAVLIASEYDPHTGGAITSFDLTAVPLQAVA
jgi:ATP-dependent protease HslVU (ClpYQ) peptidase subunit